jgi:hypothetical protein
MVGTTMYEGMCHALYTRGLVELGLACRDQGVALTLKLITNQASVPRARAYIANAFLRSGADHLMMIDADIGFTAANVLDLLTLQAQDPAYAVIGGGYPRKAIAWDQVGEAARSGREVSLAAVGGSMTVNFEAATQTLRLDRPHPVQGIAGGFAMTARHVFERLDERHPELSFVTGETAQRTFDLGPRATAYFEPMIDGEGAYLSEDYAYCSRVRAAGMQVWLCPWIELVHVGNMAFAGSFREMAKLAANPAQ